MSSDRRSRPGGRTWVLLATSLGLVFLGLLSSNTLAGRGDRDLAPCAENENVKNMIPLHREIELPGVAEVNVDLEFDSGQLCLVPGKTPGVIILDLYRDAEAGVPKVDYRSRGKIAELQLSSVEDGHVVFHGLHGHVAVRVDDDHEGDEERERSGDEEEDAEHEDEDTPSYVWEVQLPPDVPFSLHLATGASENLVDLSGIRVEDLELAAGAGEVEIRFDRPNPQPGGRLEMTAGVCRLRALGLGNGRFSSLSFEGGLGDFLLDFGGDLREDLRAEVEVGLGKLRVRLPEDLGVKVDCARGDLSSVSVEGLERQEDVYLSPNYGRAKNTLTLEVSSSLGMVEVEVVD